MFAFGVLMAPTRSHHRCRRGGLPGACRRLVAATCVVLLTVEAYLLLFGWERGLVMAAALALQMLGACLAVALALHSEPARRRLTSPWVQWVGVRSFSLYLVHEPLAVSSAALWPGLPVPAHLALVLPVSLLVAPGSHRAVEARRTGCCGRRPATSAAADRYGRPRAR